MTPSTVPCSAGQRFSKPGCHAGVLKNYRARKLTANQYASKPPAVGPTIGIGGQADGKQNAPPERGNSPNALPLPSTRLNDYCNDADVSEKIPYVAS